MKFYSSLDFVTIVHFCCSGSRFGEIRLKQDETFDEFHDKLNAIVNSILNLGERIPKPRIVRKVMRFLFERFYPKVTNIKERKIRILTKSRLKNLCDSYPNT